MAYIILCKLDCGQLLRVATACGLDEALRLAEGLYEYWPAEYSVLNIESGKNIPVNRTIGQTCDDLFERHPQEAAAQWRN